MKELRHKNNNEQITTRDNDNFNFKNKKKVN